VLPALDQAMTVSAWFFIPAATLPLGAGRKNVVALSNPSAGKSLQLGVDGGYATAWRWNSANPIFTYASAVSLPAGWHHIAYTSSGSEQSFYLEGRRVDTVSSAPPAGSVTAAFLGSYDAVDPKERLTGGIDDVRIYDQALSAAQVAALAAGDP
jgi:hypothetical protein